MTTHGDTTPTREQELKIMRDMFICFKIYDLMNEYPFDYIDGIPIIYPYDYKDDIRHAISTCSYRLKKILSE